MARQSPAFYGELSLAAHEPETIDDRKHERNMPEKRAVLLFAVVDLGSEMVREDKPSLRGLLPTTASCSQVVPRQRQDSRPLGHQNHLVPANVVALSSERPSAAIVSFNGLFGRFPSHRRPIVRTSRHGSRQHVQLKGIPRALGAFRSVSLAA